MVVLFAKKNIIVSVELVVKSYNCILCAINDHKINYVNNYPN